MGQKVRLYTDCGELLLQGVAAERAAQVVERSAVRQAAPAGA